MSKRGATTDRVYTGPEDNVVDLLKAQHERIRELLATVERTSGKARAQAFRDLVHLLAVHETAEEEIVHPTARYTITNGKRIVEARLKEEREAKEMLARLERTEVGDPEFLSQFGRLRDAVVTHAEREEREEFARLETSVPPERLKAMVTMVKAAEAVAPTHPHPGVETGMRNLLVGLPVAIIDRVRDAVRGPVS